MSDSSEKDFDDMMRRMGVTKSTDSTQAKTGKVKSIRRPKATFGSKTEAPKSGSAKPTEPVPAIPDPRIAELEAELAEARVAASEKIAALEADLESHRAEDEASPPTLGEALGALGFVSVDEQREVIGLPGVLERLASVVTVTDPSALDGCLSERIMRACEACPVPADRVRVEVEPKRCEVCGGVNLKNATRRFLDACLVNGRRRVVVVGRSPKEQHLLRSLIHDARVVLTLVPGTASRDLEAVKTDVANADAVILWDADALPSDIRSAYEDAPRHLSLGPVSVGALLVAACDVIAAD